MVRLLRGHGVALAASHAATFPYVEEITAGFVYVRLHGPDYHHLYGGSYSDQDLSWWADRMREWQYQGKEVFAYFNNDGGGNAVRNAGKLKELVYR